MGEAMTWTGDVLRQWLRWVRTHLGMTILLGVLAFLFGWIWNTYIMAVDLGGFRADAGAERNIATAEGRPYNALFWLLFFGLVSGFITYAWQRGWRNVWADLAVLPRKLGETLKHNRKGTLALLLWGLGLSLIISTVISSAISLALGLVLLTLSATPIGTIINFVVIRLWRALAGIATPTAGVGAVLVAGPFLLMIGEAAGLLLDWVFASLILGLVLGIAAAVGSILLARGLQGTATAVLFGLTVGLPLLFSGRAAWADDGGWVECCTATGEPCTEAGLMGVYYWFGNDGVTTVLANAAVGGAFAGAGTALGVGMGSVAASLAVAAAQVAAAGTGTLRQPLSEEGGPAQQPLSEQGGPPQQQPPQQQPPQGWQGTSSQDAPTQGIPTQGTPGEAGSAPSHDTAFRGPAPGAEAGAGPGDATQQLSGTGESTQWTGDPGEVTQQMPSAPQQPGSPPVEDYLPEPKDRKKGEREGDETQ